MIRYVAGNLFDSEAQALVNTVNCEGVMGKGIAYQFKNLYPQNYLSYVDACREGKLKIGTIHYFAEREKIIINFPTKNKWREKSKMEYVEKGLDELVSLIEKLEIKSIAIPPLGCGNGGLVWADVKLLIENKLSAVADKVDIYIYDPTQNYVAQKKTEPTLDLSALILMNIKMNLEKFTALRLQKTAYIIDMMSAPKSFHFQKYDFGLYDRSIDLVSKSIDEFQKYHNVDTNRAYEIALNKLISDKVENRLRLLLPIIKNASEYVNHIPDDRDLECITAILYILQTNLNLKESQIKKEFRNWFDENSQKFSDEDIQRGIDYLLATNIIEPNLLGFSISGINFVN